jgi:DNA-binding CsgD family transcriptional regulator
MTILLERTGALFEYLGRPGFDDALASLLLAAADLRQVVIFALPDASGDGRAEFSWHRTTAPLASALADRYVSGGFRRQDPTLGPLAAGLAPMRLLDRSEIPDGTYRRLFFDAANLRGKMSVWDRDTGLYMNFYKAARDPAFGDGEVDGLLSLSGLVARALARHRALAMPVALAQGAVLAPAALERRLMDRAPSLTERERQVCARIIAGFGTEAIALDLGIGMASVATYRKRAYGRLGIASQHALFALCLSP